MALPTMQLFYGDNTIEFQFNRSYNKVLDLVIFIYGIRFKFNANVISEGRFWRQTGKAFCFIKLQFDDRDDFYSARDHCYNHLTPSGLISKDYSGALKNIDPVGSEARSWLNEIDGTPYTN